MVITVLRIIRNPVDAAQTALLPVLVLVSAICVLALFASGALMSAGKADHRLMMTVHRIATAGLVAAITLVVYMLASGLAVQ